MVAAIAEGYPQHEIADAAYRYQREFDAGERRVVGVNAYVDASRATRRSRSWPCRRARSRNASSRGSSATRRERDPGAVEAALARAARSGRRDPASSDTNLMPHFIRCAAAYATLGEQCAVLREVFGEYREPVSV